MVKLLSERDWRERVYAIVGETRVSGDDWRDPYELASRLGYRVVESRDSGSPGFEGACLDDVIMLKMSDCCNEERKRFTLYHEICHGLLRRDEWLWSVLHDQFRSNRDFDIIKERLCSIGAAEFLLPRESIADLFASEPISVAHIDRLANQSSASKLASAIQLADCATHQCIMVVAARMFIPPTGQSQLLEHEDPGKTHLVVEYSMPSRPTKYRVGRYARIPCRSLIASAESALSGTLVTGRDFVPFRSGTPWEVNAEAVRLGSRVYALFHLEPPIPTDDGQLSLFSD